MRRSSLLVVTSVVLLLAGARTASPVTLQIGAGDTGRLFGGTDAEGGIGDWYVSNGIIEAIVDDVGLAPDLVGVLPPGTEPPIQSEIAPTGGNLVDLGRVGANDDQLSQLFTVGGLSTSNFILYDTVSAPSSDTLRASGKLLFPDVSPTPCIDIVTDYTAAGSDPFLTVTTTATNSCGVPATGFGGFLDAFVWTIRGLVPFSGGPAPTGGKGFNHAVLDLSNPASALEFPTFMAAPGTVRPADGIMDPANGTTCGDVSYGLLGVQVILDPDGPGGTPPTVTNVNGFFGVSSTLVSALGNNPVVSPGPGGTLTYVRHIYVGTRNDVRSASDGMIGELAARIPFSTGTISGDVDAADIADVEASILVTRVGRCSGNPALTCKTTSPICTGFGTCVDPVPTLRFGVNGAVTQIRTDATGAFAGVVLPAGNYELRVSSAERDDVVVSPVTVVAATDTPIVVPALSARGTVAFTVRERTASRPLLPAKLVFKGVSPTVDPSFHRDLAALLGTSDVQAETFGGTQAGTTGHAAGQGNVVYTATGTGDIQVRPGIYDVYAARGMEYNVVQKQITVPSGGSVAVDFSLKRVVRGRHAVSADFHVHSGRSFDASAPLRDRVAAFAGEGVEVMVSTDHDKHVDYAPIIQSFGLQSRLRSIVGDEVTGSVPNPPAFPSSIGHINAWPLTVAKDERRDGTIQDEYVAPNWVYSRLRSQGAEVIQYNHPRAGVSGLTSIGIFNNIGCNRCANAIDTPCAVATDCPVAPAPQECTCVGYQPDRPLAMAPNDILLDSGIRGPGTTANPGGLTNLDFDVMEVANGAKDSDFPQLRQVRRDWLSLLNQGFLKPGTGVSDSHRITVEHAGWSRTYVFGVGDSPSGFAVADFDAAVKAGRMLISAGPFMEVTALATGGRASLGGIVKSADGRVRLRIRVRTPAWIPVDEVRIIANGFQVAAFDATTTPGLRPLPADFQSTGRTLRFLATVPLTVTQDTYLIVEAGAKLPPDINTLPTPPAIMSIIEPNVVPEAITNPIFIDRDGNGVFDPPGLPVMMAASDAAARPAFAQVEVGQGRSVWARLWTVLGRFASRFSSDVVAQEKPAGEMTGTTKEQKAEAMKKGEYFPLHEFKIAPDVVEEMRRQQEQAEKDAADAAAPAGGK